MSNIAVVMSTYNGHSFIEEQIESILGQSFSDFKLFIRDDGSNDDTLEILKDFAGKDSRIILVNDNDGRPNENLGFGGSFSAAIKYALSFDNFDYLAFCDQDDFWLADKLMCAFKALDGVDNSQPACYACNYYICSSDLSDESKAFNSTPMQNVTFQNMFFEGVFPGFTIVINNKLARMAFSNIVNTDIYYHDKWVSLIALGMSGQITYDDRPLAKYRRHANAMSSTNLGMVAKLKWRIGTVLNGDFCPRTRKMLSEYKRLFYKDSPDDIKKFLDVFTSSRRLNKLFFAKSLRRSLSGEILLRIIILIGKI